MIDDELRDSVEIFFSDFLPVFRESLELARHDCGLELVGKVARNSTTDTWL